MEDVPAIQRLDDFMANAIQIAEKLKEPTDPVTIYYWNGIDAAVAASLLAIYYYHMQSPVHLKKFERIKDIKEELVETDNDAIIIGITFEEAKKVPKREGQTFVFTQPAKNSEVLPNVFHTGGFGYFGQHTTLAAMMFFVVSPMLDSVKNIVVQPIISALATHGQLKGLNEMILHDAIEDGQLHLQTGLTLLSLNYMPIVDAIYFSSNPILPSLTGNKNNVERLLTQAGIEIESREGERTLEDLSENEMKKLVSAIAVETSANQYLPMSAAPIGEQYILAFEPEGSILKYAHEFAQVLRDLYNENITHMAIPLLLGERDEVYYSIKAKIIDIRKSAVAGYNYIKARDFNLMKSLHYVKVDMIPWQHAQNVAKITVAEGLVPDDVAFAVITQGRNEAETSIGLVLPKKIRKDHELGNIVEIIQRTTGIVANIISQKEGDAILIENDNERQVLETIDQIIDEWVNMA